MNFMPFGQLKSFLKILIEVQYEALRSSGDISKIVEKSMHFIYLYRYNWSFIQIFCLK